jgi:glycosyltransferase involved in cell wall biosynthesis
MTKVGGSDMLVEDGVSGFTVPAGCIRSLTEALRQLTESGLRRAMSAKARERAAPHTAEAMCANTIAVYRRAMDRAMLRSARGAAAATL